MALSSSSSFVCALISSSAVNGEESQRLLFPFRPDAKTQSAFWLDDDDCMIAADGGSKSKKETQADDPFCEKVSNGLLIDHGEEVKRKAAPSLLPRVRREIASPAHCCITCCDGTTTASKANVGDSNNKDNSTTSMKSKSFVLGGFQLISNARQVEVYLDGTYATTCRGISVVPAPAAGTTPVHKGSASGYFKVLYAIPVAKRVVHQHFVLKLRGVQSSSKVDDTLSSGISSPPMTHLVMMKLTARMIVAAPAASSLATADAAMIDDASTSPPPAASAPAVAAAAAATVTLTSVSLSSFGIQAPSSAALDLGSVEVGRTEKKILTTMMESMEDRIVQRVSQQLRKDLLELSFRQHTLDAGSPQPSSLPVLSEEGKQKEQWQHQLFALQHEQRQQQLRHQQLHQMCMRLTTQQEGMIQMLQQLLNHHQHPNDILSPLNATNIAQMNIVDSESETQNEETATTRIFE